MQPTPSEHPERTTTDTDSSHEIDQQVVQHGYISDPSATPPLSGDESGGVAIPLYDTTHSEHSSVAGSPIRLQSLGGLSPPHTPAPAVRNRVSEYESASSIASRSRNEGPVFQVIKTPRAPGDKRSPIADLPNGEQPVAGVWLV